MTEKAGLTAKQPMFRKLLIANRGEIAVRILRACRDLKIPAVAVFSEVDRASLHVRMADEAYPIGPAAPRESYLCIEKLIDVARRTGCDALHPGYGFLAENPALAHTCVDAGIVFVGPSPTAMESLGSKTGARQLAHQSGVPMVPGVREPVERMEDAGRIAGEIGYPVLLKAVAGGGGKGMRVVSKPMELPGAWRDAASEALNAFGDARVYVERYLEGPRHIEIQIFGDAHGNVIYLGERECSVQRRHQKVIEEAPSAFVTSELRSAMGQAAVRLAKAARYTNAGTAEFLVDAKRNFYFLEVNTRLQVEHPVTEVVSGIDLVKLQLHIAAGHPLPFTQQQIDEHTPAVHAIECRIYAEDPENSFYPSPGKLVSWRPPQGPGIRLDDGVYAGWTVPGDYDPLLGKLITWGADRPEALARLRRALAEFDIGGIRTNAALFSRILDDSEFLRGEIHTRWLDERLASLLDTAAPASADAGALDAAAIAAALWSMDQAGVGGAPTSGSPVSAISNSKWKSEGRREQIARTPDRP